MGCACWNFQKSYDYNIIELNHMHILGTYDYNTN
jgi:hypothetical protein